MNKCLFIGRLTKDPDSRTTTNGIAVTTFTIAVDRKYKDQSGEKQTDFIPIVTWRGTAENCSRYTAKGSLVAVVGSMQTRSYEAQDGSKRYVTEIVADEVQFLDSKKHADGTATLENAGFEEAEPEFPF